jgi:XTP/dITP diphosphohydrolase
MTPTLVVATGNVHKVCEIGTAAVAAGLEYTFRAISELVPDWPSPVEDGGSFEANAAIKAHAGFEALGLPTVADDSGLEVDALDGAPGVYSSRYSGVEGDDARNNEKLLRELAKRDEAEQRGRRARFVSCLVLTGLDRLLPDAPDYLTVSGVCEGRIAHEPRGTGGFGYDPLFLPEAVPGYTMAELGMDEKNAISHRGRALRALMDALRRY